MLQKKIVDLMLSKVNVNVMICQVSYLPLIDTGDGVVSVSDAAGTDDVTVELTVSTRREQPTVTAGILARLYGVQ